MPVLLLPAMTLREAGLGRPTVLLLALEKATPLLPLPRSRLPLTSTPM